jgi:hypothetical protein
MHYRLVHGVFEIQAVYQFDVIIGLIEEFHKVCAEEQFLIVSSHKVLDVGFLWGAPQPYL